MKKYILIPIILCIILFSFLIGIYIYKINNIGEEQPNIEIAKEEKLEDECTAEYEYLEQIKEANAKKEKVSPNAELVMNIYYDECGHTTTNTTTVEDKYINLTQEELQEEYEEWEVKEFANDKIVLYKQQEGICNEHYLAKEKDGYIAIYSLDENENEKLEYVTEISTKFLPNTDLAKLQGGIRAYGKESLNSLLEDFE